MNLQPNTTLQGGKYRIERLLGQGGFGNTYVGYNTIFDERIAIKEFFMRGVTERDDTTCAVSVSNEENVAQFEEQREKFKKEARRLRKLKNEQIVKVHDLFEENGTAYYVMDYIEGDNLAERMKRTGKPFSETEVRNILPQILSALKEVHQNEIWHLDIKPGNIMLDKDGNAYLIDFGASKQIRANGSITTSTALCYTPGYAPNEQIGQMYDRFGPWTDIYALGATIYTLLTNKRPPMAIDIEEDEEDAFDFSDGVSDKMRNMIIWMMKPQRKKRPQNVDEIMDYLSKNDQIVHKEVPATPQSDSENTFIVSSMTRQEIEEMGRKVFTDILCITAEECTDDKDIVDDLGADSLDVVELTMELEKRFGIFIKDNEAANIRTVRDCLDALVRKVLHEDRNTHREALDVIPNNDEGTVIIPRSSPVKIDVPKGQFNPVIQKLFNNMVRIEGGTFMMGASEEQGIEANDRERPVHQVTLSSFSIGRYEVTQEEWETVMGSNPSLFKGAKRPVDSISWDDCQAFISKLNAITKKQFRLPTEAEWEYAARGGKRSHGYRYAGSNNIEIVAWHENNSNNMTHNVGMKQPNELNLYDMSGNVWEWCLDWYDKYNSSSTTNPQGPFKGSLRVLRGGSWSDWFIICRVPYRNFFSPNYRNCTFGLRLAL